MQIIKKYITLICTLLTALFITLVLMTWTTHDFFQFNSIMGIPQDKTVYNHDYIYQERGFNINQEPLILGRSDLLARKAEEYHIALDYDKETGLYALTNISNARKVLTKNEGVTRYAREWQLSAGDQFIFGKEKIKIMEVNKDKLRLTVNAIPFEISTKTFQVQMAQQNTPEQGQIVLATPWKEQESTPITPIQCQDTKEKVKHYALYSIFKAEPHFQIFLGGAYHCEDNIPLTGIDYRAYMIEYRDQHFFLRPFKRGATKKGDVFKLMKNGHYLSIDEQPLYFKVDEQILITLGYSSYSLLFTKNTTGNARVIFRTLNKGDIKENTINIEHKRQQDQNESVILDRTSKETKKALFSSGTLGFTLGIILNMVLWFLSSTQLKQFNIRLKPWIHFALGSGVFLFTMGLLILIIFKKDLFPFQTSDIAMMLWVSILFSLLYLWINQSSAILYFYLSTLILLGYGILYSWHLQELAKSTKYYNDFKEQLFFILWGVQLWAFVLYYQQIILKVIMPLATQNQFSLDEVQPYLTRIGLLFLVWLWFGKIPTLFIICSVLFLKVSVLKSDSLLSFIIQLIWQLIWLSVFLFFGIEISWIIMLFIIGAYSTLIILINQSRKLRNKINSGQKIPKQIGRKISREFNRLLSKSKMQKFLIFIFFCTLILSVLTILFHSPLYIYAFSFSLTVLVLLLLSFSHHRYLLPYLLILSLSLSFILVYAGAGSETGIQGIQPMEFMKLLFCLILAFALFLFSHYKMRFQSYFLPFFAFTSLAGTLVMTSLLTSDQSFLVLMFWSFIFSSGFLLITSDACNHKISWLAPSTRLVLFILCMPLLFYFIVPKIIHFANHFGSSATGTARYAAWQAPEKYPFSGSQFQYATCVYLIHYKEKLDKCYIGPNEMLPREIKISHLSNVDDDFALTGFIAATPLVKNIPFYLGLALFIGFQVLWFMSLLATLKPFIQDINTDWQVKIYGLFLFAGLGFVQAHILIAWGSNTGLLPVMGQPMTFLGRQGSHLVLFIFPFLYIVSLVVGLLKEKKQNVST